MPKPEREWTPEDASRAWRRMRRDVTFVGWPGHSMNPAVCWNGAVQFYPAPQRVPADVDWADYERRLLKAASDPGVIDAAALSEWAEYARDGLEIELGFGAEPAFRERHEHAGAFRQRLEEGYLPVVLTEHDDGDLAWRQTLFCYVAEGEQVVTGRETLVTELLYEVSNRAVAPRTAHLWAQLGGPHLVFGYKVQHRSKSIPYGRALSWREPLVLDDQGRARLAVGVDAPGRAEFIAALGPESRGAAWDAMRTAGLDSNLLHLTAPVPPAGLARFRLTVPFWPVRPELLAGVLAVPGQTHLARVRNYWRAVFGSADTFEVPDPLARDFYNAGLYHAMVATGRRPKSGHVILKTSPNNYEGLWGAHMALGAYSMDLRGLHGWARQCYDTLLANQGPVGPYLHADSRFRVSGEGYGPHPGFLGAIPGHMAYLWVQYHGWVLWCLVQHCLLTADRDWYARNAERLVLACDWLCEQRGRTKRTEGGRPVPHYGLLPPAVSFDWGAGNFCWNEAFNYKGLDAMASLLTLNGHPEAARIRAEAEDYSRCIVAAWTRARDAAEPLPIAGGAIPYVPDCIQQLDYRRTDWTYAIAGPLALCWGGVVPPRHELIEQALAVLRAGRPVGPRATGRSADGRAVLYEGNTFSGHGVGVAADEDFLPSCNAVPGGRALWWRENMTYEPGWFTPHFTWLLRDDVPDLVRALYSQLSEGAMHVDLRSTVESRDGVPWCQPGDANLMTLLRWMVVRDDGGSLDLCGSVPRAWLEDGCAVRLERTPTRFGPVSACVESRVADGFIRARIAVPQRQPPGLVRLRLRHPAGLPPLEARINGARVTPAGEWIETRPVAAEIEIVASY